MVGRISALLSVGILLGALCSERSPAQIIAMANGPAGDDGPKTPGFSVHKEPQAIVDALSEFERYCGKEAWEKAFASLAIAADANPTGLMPAKDGFYLPTRLRVRQALMGLSPAGRAAYRLFDDAKAKQAFDQLGASINPQQRSALRKIADQYFISSIGDQANDRLGDALFESGDFAGAAAQWQSILSDFPDSSIPPLRLLTKRAIALARSGDASGFAEVLASVRARYPGEQVHLGGKDMVAADYLAALPLVPTTEPADGGAAELSNAAPASLELPTQPTPAWQFPLMDEETHRQIEQTLNNMGWGMMASNLINSFTPIDLDAKHVYVNWLSVCFALDVHTGKMVWRSDKFSDQPQRIQQLLQQGQDLSGDAVAAAGAQVLFVRRDPKQQDFNAPRQLIALAADTGKKLWSSDDQAELKEWNFSGTPLLVGPTAFIVVHQQQQQNANLLAISIKDGSLKWKLPLGTDTQRQNFRGMMVSPEAVLAAGGSKIYVLTNNGALLAVDMPSHALDWAFTYNPAPPGFDPRFGFNPNFQGTAVHSPGALKIVGSTLLFKEADNPVMYALDLTSPSLLWRRPVDESEMIAHADSQGVLLLGDDLSYMDMASRRLQWSAHLPGLGSAVRPILSPGRIDLFLPRGIFEMDTSDGDTLRIFRGYDHDGAGGTLWRAGDRLLAVSDRTITAYPIR
jgi:outer membrane protein assembly factor BamB/TolA-binding protein